MGKLSAQLYHLIKSYALADRNPEFAQLELMLQRGLISEGMAKAFLYRVQDSIDEQIDFPCPLHRAPTAEQLYAEGKPDVEIGSLAEGDQLRYGIRLLDRPRHILAAGPSGVGKTTLFRVLIAGVERLNEEIEKETDQSDCA